MLMGQLKSFSLESLFQICYNENNTGAIEFSKHDRIYGQIGFLNGSVVYADFLDLKGMDAIKQISLLKDIDFKYNDDNEPKIKNIETDITFLSLELSRCKDEGLEYLSTLTQSFSSNFNILDVSFFEYDNSFFAFPDEYNIRYFESFVDDLFFIVYLDKQINMRIKITFKDHIPSDSLLIFMQEKDIL